MDTVLRIRTCHMSSASPLALLQKGPWPTTTRDSRLRRIVRTRVSSELVEPLTLSSNPDLTWQTTVGAIAGVTPFVIAGIEFSKRIIQQRRCQVCGGSGLVKRAGLLVRCNGCGGFLPWQSWGRFFTSKR